MFNGEQLAAELWKIAAERLRSMVPANIYEQWFSNMMPLRLDGACLVLGVGDDFFAEWVEKSYSTQINEALSNIAGHDYGHLFEAGHFPQVQEESVSVPPNTDLGDYCMPVFAYVKTHYGGAYKTLLFAHKQKKPFINLYQGDYELY